MALTFETSKKNIQIECSFLTLEIKLILYINLIKSLNVWLKISFYIFDKMPTIFFVQSNMASI